jgi:L-alanine-DL-glutamate epimerase-like enolase superfamily enzyme
MTHWVKDHPHTMKIDKVRVCQTALPFSGDFSHARRKASSAHNIIVEIIANHGKIRGYGEGAPRIHVTGESQESAAESVKRLVMSKEFPWNLENISEVWGFGDKLRVEKEQHSALCSVELALLDALGRAESKPVIEYLPKDFITGKVRYGAAVPMASEERVTELCGLIRSLGINKLRIKMGKDFEQNQKSMRIVTGYFGEECDLRVDVNGGWDEACAFEHLDLLLKHKVSVVEQPMMPGDKRTGRFAAELRAHGIALMADESACTLSEVEALIQQGWYSMANVRLSKCGGFGNSLKIVDFLRKNGLSFQIGCQLGESGVLSAAGRALCLVNRDAAYYDGSYDKFLLEENTTVEDVSFGPGGEAGPLKGSGLGMEVDKEKMEHLSDPSKMTTIQRP